VCFAAIGYLAFPKLAAQQKEFEANKLLEARYAVDDAPEPAREPRPVLEPSSAEPPAPRSVSPSPAPPSPVVPPSPGAGPPLDLPTLIGTGESVRTATGAEGSPNFQAWVRNVKITGLRTGNQPRILIGGASFDVGETVSSEFGILFDGYDAERRVLRFRDATGVVLERRHP
jgi:hypothetical protein